MKFTDIEKEFLKLLEEIPELQSRWDFYHEQLLRIQQAAERDCITILKHQMNINPKIERLVTENFWELLA